MRQDTKVQYRPDDWLSAAAAVEAISSSQGEHVAKDTLLSLLVNGSLVCKADTIAREADVGTVIWDDIVWSQFHRANTKRKAFVRHSTVLPYQLLLVPEDFLSVGDGWAADLSLVSWAEGRFVARRTEPLRHIPLKRSVFIDGDSAGSTTSIDTPTDVMMRHIVSGLCIQRSQIEDIAGVQAAGKDQSKAVTENAPQARATASKAGRRRSELWEEWTAELAALIHDQGLSADPTVREIYDTVANRLDERGHSSPSEEAAQRTISRVIARFRLPDQAR